MKNILITTLGRTKNKLDMNYYHVERTNGERMFCNGISQAEAGSKYVLATKDIDQIHVIVPSEYVKDEDEVNKVSLISHQFPVHANVDEYSEYGFYCYRMQQYVTGVDIEADDINHSLSESRKGDVLSLFNNENKKYSLSKVPSQVFYEASIDDKYYKSIVNDLRPILSPDDRAWLAHHFYFEMNSYRKLRCLESNKDIVIKPIVIDEEEYNSFDVNKISSVLSEISFTDNEVGVYLDLNGMDFGESFSLFSTFMMLESCFNKRFDIKGIIETTYAYDKLTNPVENDNERYDIQQLLFGLDILKKYGKVDQVKEYWDNHEHNNPDLDMLLFGLQYVDDGISLCNVPLFKYGIEVIRKVFKKNEDKHLKEVDLAYALLTNAIANDYKKLLEGDELDMPSLIEWTLNKKMYQQVLTIIESLVPEDIVKSGIYYYASSKDDLDTFLREMNVMFWNENGKNRYFFNDLAHYFIKSYGRNFINNKQDKNGISHDLTHVKIKQLHENDKMLKAYSDVDDDNLLSELLFTYYDLGVTRNNICHARPPMNALDNGEEMQEPNNYAVVDKEVSKFIKLYRSAKEKANRNRRPNMIVSPEDFKSYTSKHRLSPLNNLDDENVINSSYSVDYNGTNIDINIKMLKPEGY